MELLPLISWPGGYTVSLYALLHAIVLGSFGHTWRRKSDAEERGARAVAGCTSVLVLLRITDFGQL